MAQTQSGVRRLLRRDMANLEPYPAPQPLEDFARSIGTTPGAVVKLDQNENPYGCSPRVSEALGHFAWYHVYPDPDHRQLRDRLGEYVGVSPTNVVVGNGSDELIELILRMFIEPGDRVLSASPTFGYYDTAAAAAGAQYVTVPRGPAFELDPDATAAQLTPETKLIFVATPNNPTGNSTPLATIRALLDLGPVVVVDEAYFEFHRQTAVTLFAEGAPDNLIVLRTFSKWAGLAGLRLGYAIFPSELVSTVQASKPPYSVSQAAEVAGLASLADLDYLLGTVDRILAERARLRAGLDATGFLRTYPSDANFLLCDVIGRSAAVVQEQLAARAILVRRYASHRLENSLRITVGRPEHTDRLLAALQEIT